jgi:hypothetical protein
LSAAWLYQSAQQGHVPAIERIAELGIDHKPGRHPSCILSDGRFADYNFKPHPARGRVAKLVRRLAPKYKLDPNLVLAVIEVESGFDVRALSPKNAQGLMRIIPETASRFGVRNVWDAEQNVRGGMAYLRWLIKNFSGDARLALAAYNAVERAVERHGGVPPYEETRSYVERILRGLQRRKTACDAPRNPPDAEITSRRPTVFLRGRHHSPKRECRRQAEMWAQGPVGVPATRPRATNDNRGYGGFTTWQQP